MERWETEGFMPEREAVAAAGRRLLAEGLAARTWGNVSCRTGEASFVITPSGLSYERMRPEDVVPFDMRTGSWTGARQPSSEKGVHTAAYRRFPEAGFVVHTHQCFATAIGLAGFERLALSPEENEALGGVALAAYALPGSKKLQRRVESALASGAHCLLMAHHGALIAGRDAPEAFRRALLLETAARRACMGQPRDGDEAASGAGAALLAGARARFGHAALADTPAVLAAARLGAFRAELDDMAQMIGPRLAAARAETALRLLERHAAVLVPG
ncbi:MAG: class II aldolase/adducin family protein, partial [Clostridia bacterium]|nr:class II aldolase/adducin family protein [Clostridia bacterium]